MKRNSLLILFVLLAFNQACNARDMPTFLIGTWKVKDKNTYEQWHVDNQSVFKGISYQLKDGKKQISENIEINNTTGQMIYIATVMNQNDGKAIDFKLNPDIKNKYVFVNRQHDFPNSLSYQRLSEEKVFVQVLGNDGRGFSYEMHKQKNDQ